MIIMNQDCSRCNQPIDLAPTFPVDSGRYTVMQQSTEHSMQHLQRTQQASRSPPDYIYRHQTARRAVLVAFLFLFD